MNTTPATSGEQPEPGRYEIRLRGHLDRHQADWFGGLRVTYDSDGTTVLAGPMADQAALHGWLRRVRDLGLPLTAVTQVNPNQTNRREVNPDRDQAGSNKETCR